MRVDDISTLPRSPIWVTKRFQTYASFRALDFNFDSSATAQLQAGHAYQWPVERFNTDGEDSPFEESSSILRTFSINSKSAQDQLQGRVVYNI